MARRGKAASCLRSELRRSTSQWQEKSYDSCCSTRFRGTWPWSADTEPVHRLRALLSRLVAPRNWSCTSLKLFFSVSRLSSSHSLCLCRWPTYQLTAAGSLYLDNAFTYKKTKCSEWRQYGSTAQYDFRRDCYVGGKTFPEIFCLKYKLLANVNFQTTFKSSIQDDLCWHPTALFNVWKSITDK